jgi:hypothetical protein
MGKSQEAGIEPSQENMLWGLAVKTNYQVRRDAGTTLSEKEKRGSELDFD